MFEAVDHLQQHDGVAVVMAVVSVGGFVTPCLQHGVNLNQENVPMTLFVCTMHTSVLSCVPAQDIPRLQETIKCSASFST